MRAAIWIAIVVAACGPGARQDDDNFGDDDGSGSNTGSGSDTGDGGVTVNVYAHTATELYSVNPDTLAITKVGNFGWPSGTTDEMTDIAIDKTGDMLGVSFGSVYRIDPTNAKTTRLTNNLTGGFNGLSFVPAEMLGQTGDDILVGTRNSDGKVFEIDPNSGATTQVGDMGGGYSSSGDLVAVEGFGTVQTVAGVSGDVLTKLAPNSFTASAIGSGTGYSQIWGVAFWKNKIYGFTNGGAFILIDATTGVGTMVQQNGPAWYGAAVTTAAPVIQ
ncbi:MAG: hypothetical protein QM831_43085 [Kofleriaceae bacterium]